LSPLLTSLTGGVGADEEKKQSGAVAERPERRQVCAVTLSTALRDDDITDLHKSLSSVSVYTESDDLFSNSAITSCELDVVV
jgi:hypothetical protein